MQEKNEENPKCYFRNSLKIRSTTSEILLKTEELLPFLLFHISLHILQERQPLNDFFATYEAIQLLVLGLHNVRNLPLVL